MYNDIITEDSGVKVKGRWIECKICHKKFKFKSKHAGLAWRDVNFLCPFCEQEYCIMPETERELRKLQDLYFIHNRADRYMNKMFKILVNYASSMIKKEVKRKKWLIQEEQLIDYATDAASLLVEKYSDPKFVMHTSFGKFLSFKVYEALYAKKRRDIDAMTLNYRLPDGSFSDQEDHQKRELDFFLDDQHMVSIVEDLMNLIEGIGWKTNSKLENYIRLLTVNIFLEKGEKAFSNFFKTYPRHYGKAISDRTIDIIRLELLEMYGEKSFKSIVSSVKSE